jgi:hypothetical protein
LFQADEVFLTNSLMVVMPVASIDDVKIGRNVPGEITLLDVVEAAEGPIRLDQCVLRGGPCDWDTSCPVHVPWNRAINALMEELAKTTFADLALHCAEIAAGTYVLPENTPPHAIVTPRRLAGSTGGTDMP